MSALTVKVLGNALSALLFLFFWLLYLRSCNASAFINVTSLCMANQMCEGVGLININTVNYGKGENFEEDGFCNLATIRA